MSTNEFPYEPNGDPLSAAVRKLLTRAKERGYVTYDEINQALPENQVGSELIEDTMAMLSEAGVNVVEAEDEDNGPDATRA